MAAHVIHGDLVRDALKAEVVKQPVEQRRGVVLFDGGTQRLIPKLVEQLKRARETADLMNDAGRVSKSSGVEIKWFCC
jgi:hypothetical protein